MLFVRSIEMHGTRRTVNRLHLIDRMVAGLLPPTGWPPEALGGLTSLIVRQIMHLNTDRSLGNLSDESQHMQLRFPAVFTI